MDISRPDGLVLEHLVLSLALKAVRDVARRAKSMASKNDGEDTELARRMMKEALDDISELCDQPIGRGLDDAKADIEKIVDRWGNGGELVSQAWLAELTAWRGGVGRG